VGRVVGELGEVVPQFFVHLTRIGRLSADDAHGFDDACGIGRAFCPVAEREGVTARLRELGYDFPSTYANFVWLPLGERTGDFVQLMSEHALSVRAFGTEGVRVSIGEVEANDRFLSLCEVFAKGL